MIAPASLAVIKKLNKNSAAFKNMAYYIHTRISQKIIKKNLQKKRYASDFFWHTIYVRAKPRGAVSVNRRPATGARLLPVSGDMGFAATRKVKRPSNSSARNSGGGMAVRWRQAELIQWCQNAHLVFSIPG